MKKRVLGVKSRKLTQRMKDALVKAEVKAAKKNVASLDPENFSALECVDLFLAIKYESNNTFNPIWVNALNKNGDIPSGAQLTDLLDKVREGAFALKESLRIKYLLQGRKRDAKFLLLKAGVTPVVAEVIEIDDPESEVQNKSAGEIKVSLSLCCIPFIASIHMSLLRSPLPSSYQYHFYSVPVPLSLPLLSVSLSLCFCLSISPTLL
jgi:hypothetical protein